MPESRPPSAWRPWLAALLWLGVIVLESTDYFSSARTGGLLYALVSGVIGPVDLARFAVAHAVLRKIGHFVGYGVLTFLLFRAWRATLRVAAPTGWIMRWAAVSLLMTVVVAGLDEWHQSFLSSRTGTFHDVVLDSMAAVFAQLMILAGTGNPRRRKVHKT